MSESQEWAIWIHRYLRANPQARLSARGCIAFAFMMTRILKGHKPGLQSQPSRVQRSYDLSEISAAVEEQEVSFNIES